MIPLFSCVQHEWQSQGGDLYGTREERIEEESATLFSKVHSLVSHANIRTTAEVESGVKDKFVNHWRDNPLQSTGSDGKQWFGGVFSKLHWLDIHCVQTLRATKTGFGVISEQGVEAIHKVVNNVIDRHSQGKSKLEQLEYALHILSLRVLCTMYREGLTLF